ncbi:hypothetical protein V2647_07805 [Tenacibaculum maritimum]|uniref:hypothetical protein n=1 Tax=Tenacibaculum maritimum TaxID=107401 RepID=UPI0012E58E52|nr:hypothetical protein [Tenacibaculum maritimum]CAA0185559.1 conserved hypothetical protein [Tenacibaculum maritimum]CAA0215909.1 conserved hypothetical protein [Tenacibaculum maritimum]
MSYIEYVGNKLDLFVIGLISGLISAKVEDTKGVFNYTFRAFTGAAMTTFTTPMLVDYFNFSNNSAYGVAFFIGLVSMNLAGAALKLSENLELIKRIFSK